MLPTPRLPLSPSLCLAVVVLISATSVGAEPTNIKTTHFDDFSLPSTDDRPVSFSRDPSVELHVLCFLGTECPLARIYGPRLEKMAGDYADRGVRFIGINSNVQDSMQELKEYTRQHGITFPIVKDHDRQVALSAGATRTPEVFVVDRSGSIRYQGRIDDQYQPGQARSEARVHDLRDALDQLLAGESVTRPRTDAVGCLISLPRETTANTDVSFCNQISRILNQHCVECHREGEIGPFALDDYDEVVGWADMSLEVIDQGRMPPWHASPDHGSFANARQMPEKDKQTLRRWVDAGMPYGDAKQLPPKPEYLTGWRLPRTPDLVLEMSDKPFPIPAEGTVEYQYYVVDPGFKEDKWITASQVIPGNSAVVHHCIAFVRPPDGSDFRDIGMLGAYVPGQIQAALPKGYARRVKAGSLIVFQMHYTPIGKPVEDNTRIGLVFADPKEVTHEVYALGGIEQEFEVPPGDPNHQVDGDIRSFPKDGELLSILPHMHLRGKSFEFRVRRKDGQQTLLSVPHYDFNWQHVYQLTEPLPLNDIDGLEFTAVFDNSADNPTNPDPTEFVTWGDQTWQEMAVTFIAVAEPLKKQAKPKREPSAAQRKQEQLQNQQRERQAQEFADRYIERFDSNGDQHLSSRELPDSVRMFSFWHFDHDGDARLSRDEIKAEAEWRLKHSRARR